MSRLFASGGRSIGASASSSVFPMSIQELISFRVDWFDLAVQGALKSLLQPIPQFQRFDSSVLSFGAWKAAVHGVTEGRTQLSDFTFTFHFPALEKEMATHSSMLAW